MYSIYYITSYVGSFFSKNKAQAVNTSALQGQPVDALDFLANAQRVLNEAKSEAHPLVRATELAQEKVEDCRLKK